MVRDTKEGEHTEGETKQDQLTPVQEETKDYVVSIHALNGTQGLPTLKVDGTIKGKSIQLIIYTGFTHNFIFSNTYQTAKTKSTGMQKAESTTSKWHHHSMWS